MTKITIMHIFQEKSSVKKKMMLLDKKYDVGIGRVIEKIETGK